MVTPLDSKFSTFADGGDLEVDDIVVGLRDGINTRFSFQGTPGVYLPLAGGTMSGSIDMDSNSITDLPLPSAGGDASNKSYVDTAVAAAVAGYLPLAGGTMSGAIDMGTFKVTNAGNPTNPQDLTTKFYVDALVGAASPLTTKGDLWGYTTVNARLPVGTTNGQVLQVASGAAAGLAYSTAAYPLVATSTGSFIYANGTNFVQSTSLWPNTVGTAGKILQSDGTINDYSTPIWPTTGGTAGSIVISDGTNKINSTSLWPNTVGTVGKIIRSDGTTNAYSTSTFADTYLINTIPFAGSADTISGATLTSIIDTTIGSTQGNILYRNATDWVVLAPGTSGQFLQTQGAAANPIWAPGDGAGTVTSITAGTGLTLTPNPITSSGTVALTTPVSLTDGGSNASLVASLGGIVYSTATALAILSGTATAGQMLQSGASAAPTWSTATYPATATGTGTILRANGTNWVASTATYPDVATSTGSFLYANGTNYVASTSLWPNTVGSSGTILRSNGTSNVYTTSTFADTYSVSTILYASSANVVTGLATANNGVLITSAGGVPSISSTLPSGIAATNMSLTTPALGTPSSGVLTNATGYTVANLADSAWTDFSGSVGFTGFSANPTAVVARYKKIGNTCFIFISMTAGTSNATSFTMTGMPFTSATGITQITGAMNGTNNNVAVAGIDGVFTTASTTLILRLLGNGGGFTAALGKGFSGMFFYETQ